MGPSLYLERLVQAVVPRAGGRVRRGVRVRLRGPGPRLPARSDRAEAALQPGCPGRALARSDAGGVATAGGPYRSRRAALRRQAPRRAALLPPALLGGGGPASLARQSRPADALGSRVAAAPGPEGPRAS